MENDRDSVLDLCEGCHAYPCRCDDMHLKELCVKLLSTTDDTNWKELATRVAQEYEKLRADAGLLYRVVVPQARFGVLGVAL